MLHIVTHSPLQQPPEMYSILFLPICTNPYKSTGSGELFSYSNLASTWTTRHYFWSSSSYNMHHGPSSLSLITVVPTPPVCLLLPATRIPLILWTSGGMTSGRKALWIQWWKTESFPLFAVSPPADNLPLSGNRPVASLLWFGPSSAESAEYKMWLCAKWLCIAAKKKREAVVINHCPPLKRLCQPQWFQT